MEVLSKYVSSFEVDYKEKSCRVWFGENYGVYWYGKWIIWWCSVIVYIRIWVCSWKFYYKWLFKIVWDLNIMVLIKVKYWLCWFSKCYKRVYFVLGFNSLWYIDGYYNLVKWGICCLWGNWWVFEMYSIF